MPRGDGTGPNGLGPMTGRGAGYCVGYFAPGYTNQIAGRGGFGFGRGGGRGRGWGRGWQGAYPYASAPTAKEEMNILKEQSEMLKQELQGIQERMDTIESKEKEK